MKKILFAFALLTGIANTVFSQILNPVKWTFESKKISDSEYDLVATAKLDKGWYIYSQFIGDGGPVPTVFSFTAAPQYQLVGKVNEISDHKKSGFDKIFEMNITKFSDEVKFVQRVKVTGAGEVKGSVEWQTCDDEKCLPPNSEDFTYKIGGSAGAPAAQPATNNGNASLTPTPPVPTKSSGIVKPVKWAFEAKKIGDLEYDIVLKATIQPGWHVYSQFLQNDEGPIPTTITFEKDGNVELVGKAKEESPERKKRKEPAFNNVEVVDFSQSATFTQRVKVKDNQKSVKGSVEFMVCDATRCLPPEEVKFIISLAMGQGAEVTETAPTTEGPTGLANAAVITDPSLFKFDKTNENANCDAQPPAKEDLTSLWVIFILGFGGGLLALLTPCVFPMIPLTVSFFVKSSKDRATGLRNALLYGLSIIVIYVSMGLLITAVFGSDALNRLSTNPWVNIAFGVLFFVFAISFFGYFEITLPASWSTKADEASNRGGLIGIFFMAFTLALVSFSCTGPIIGTLLVQAGTTTGISAGPAVGMLGFATALALPFGLFAMFPAWLQSLPKSGSWMDDVKVTLGFIEVALAFKFLSNADLIFGKKLLPYEAFLAIWILCGLGLALYHAGLLSFKKDTRVKKWTVARTTIVGLSVAAVAYLSMGFRYSDVTETFRTPELASGILPPAGYSYIYPQKCPLNINCFHDLNEGMAYAKKVNKPILLDFTGWNCANCRKMEENVWNQPAILPLIREKYVLISLYTDDKRALQAPYAPYTSKFDGKLKDTEGEMWTDLEATHFNRNSQPFYVLMTPNGKLLNAPVAYTPVVEEYRSFLQCGLDKFAQEAAPTAQ